VADQRGQVNAAHWSIAEFVHGVQRISVGQPERDDGSVNSRLQ
jgi:hypothetical protein